MRMFSLLAIAMLLAFASPSFAQVTDGAAPLEALASHPVSQLVGDWRGSGWAMQPDRTHHEFEAVERARWNLAGTAIIIEGYGFLDDETGARQVGHDAFALVTWDEETETVKFHARRAGEAFQTYDMIWDEDREALTWELQPNRVRFIITVKNGVWRETGEFSPDGGENWMEFLEMTLERGE